jgi:hypothetical protein
MDSRRKKFLILIKARLKEIEKSMAIGNLIKQRFFCIHQSISS